MNIVYNLHRHLWNALDWLYPPVCASCGQPGCRFCADCLSKVSIIKGSFCAFCGKKIAVTRVTCHDCADQPVFFDAAASWAEYRGTLREAIHSFKYKDNLALGDHFAPFLIDLLNGKKWNFDLVVPVPLSRERRKERGYNQSALLSRPIARYFGVEFSSSSLIRVKDTGSQINRSRRERIEFVKDAFLGNPAKLKGRNVLLVDDIITTGSTINHCSKALVDAGVTSVMAISLAKTQLPKHNREDGVQMESKSN